MSKQAIEAGHTRFLDGMRANSSAGLVAEIADDAVFYPPNHSPVRGKAAVKAWYEGVLAEATTAGVSVTERDVVVAGDWGIERGKVAWTLAPVGGGDEFTFRGHFIAIWKRDPSGAWKVSSDIWNSSDSQ